MGKSPSIIKQTLNRLNSKMAIGISRYEAKQEARTTAHTGGQSAPWTVSDGRIHSYVTRRTYQQQVLRFVSWARATEGIRQLDKLDERREELAARYLQQHINDKRSPYTLQVERAALRCFFADRQLAASVALPRRSRSAITRSRAPAIRDRGFREANHPDLVAFLRATGLRRSEVRDLRERDVLQRGEQVHVLVRNGKGGKVREVPVRPGHESAVLRVLAGRQPGQRVFDHIPSHMDVHSYRREFAQEMYRQLSGRDLPPASGRLRPSDYDKAAVYLVSRALGHNRLDVVLRHYLR